MRLEGLRVERDAGRVRRAIDLAWIGGGREMSVTVADEHAPADHDLSPFVPIALLAAMRRAEPLQIDGSVSSVLLGNLAHAQTVVHSFNPTLQPVPVRAAAVHEDGARTGGRACFFSRGIDSSYSAAVEREPGGALSCLVHWRDFELMFSEPTREREVELVEDAGRLVGLPVVVAECDAHEVLVDVVDFDDATSAMLACVALSLPGLAGRFVVPSAFSYADLVMTGTSPLLDCLWSTGQVAIEHDSCIPTREEKLEWLVDSRPELLELLHVCLGQDSHENCGECGKCVWAMLLLHVHGALELASFPDRLDPDVLAKAPRPGVQLFTVLERVYRRLGTTSEDEKLKRAMLSVLRSATREPMPPGLLSMNAQHMRRLWFLMRGQLSDVAVRGSSAPSAEVAPLDPAWPPPRDTPPGLIGLVRAVDHEARGHRYAAGGLPPGQRTGELGALLEAQPPEGVALELDVEGRPVIAGLPRGNARAAGARWALEPLLWRGAGVRARARSAARRLVDSAGARRTRSEASRPRRAGWLHAAGGDGRLELMAAAHPVLEDVLLTTDRAEARELGYGEPVSIGFLEARAPVTGSLGTAASPIAWARHWGRRERPASR